MTRRVPLLATIVVAAAVAIMLALGVWQLQRAKWKDALLARYSAAEARAGAVPWPRTEEEREQALYRPSAVECQRVLDFRATAGRSALGQPGWAHVARCQLPDGGEAEVAIGWSGQPVAPAWPGGRVTGSLAPAGEGVRLIAAPAEAGLSELAPPDPNDLPNNHLAYAVQWFFFALTAVVVYILALRRR